MTPVTIEATARTAVDTPAQEANRAALLRPPGSISARRPASSCSSEACRIPLIRFLVIAVDVASRCGLSLE